MNEWEQQICKCIFILNIIHSFKQAIKRPHFNLHLFQKLKVGWQLIWHFGCEKPSDKNQNAEKLHLSRSHIKLKNEYNIQWLITTVYV